MGLISNLFKSFGDMKKMADFQKILQKACDELDKEGKLPSDIKEFMATANKGTTDTGNAADQIKVLENGLKLFEQHSDLFDEKIEKVVKDYEAKAAEVEKFATDIHKQD